MLHRIASSKTPSIRYFAWTFTRGDELICITFQDVDGSALATLEMHTRFARVCFQGSGETRDAAFSELRRRIYHMYFITKRAFDRYQK